MKLRAEFGSFHSYIYKFTNGKHAINDIKSAKDMPASSEFLERILIDMKKRGFKFAGAIIIYSFYRALAS